MTHYTVITARPVMRSFDDAMKATKAPTDEDETRAYAVAQYDAAVMSGDTNRASWCEWEIGVLMKAEAKEIKKAGRGVTSNTFGPKRTVDKGKLTPSSQAVLDAIIETPNLATREISCASGVNYNSVYSIIGNLRSWGYGIVSERGVKDTRHTFLGKQEATQ